MINPPPRPALRKAPDADVHPVAPMPSAVPAPEPPRVPSCGPSPVSAAGPRTRWCTRSKKVKLTTLEVKVPKRVAKAPRSRRRKPADNALTMWSGRLC